MVVISFKALGYWFHNSIVIILFYFMNFQKMVTVPDFEYFKSIGVFVLFFFYFLTTIIFHVFKILEKKVDLKTKIEILKAKEEIRKYIENKNRKS